MFFAPHVVEGIANVEYGFDEPNLRQAALEFRSALVETETSLKNDNIKLYVPLKEIASSVQF